MSKNAKVFVVDDDKAMLDSLSWLMESVGLEVETFGSAAEFLEKFEPGSPGCLILDIRMPEISGLALQEMLRNEKIDLPVIVISGHADVYGAVTAMKHGAIDFLEKPFSHQKLLDLVQQGIRKDLRSRMKKEEREELAQKMAALTNREREVIQKVVLGKSNKVIATELGLSPRTVEAYRANAMSKLEAETLADVMRICIAAMEKKDII